MSYSHHPSSYRDPAGFLFYKDDVLYRQVNQSYSHDFDLFIGSGLYEHLLQQNLIVPHRVIEGNLTGLDKHYVTLQPEVVPLISYPCEWSFDMLKDAALATLQLAEEGMEKGMTLKDASAYNIQFHNGRMKLIDTLSFEKYDETKPWIAYRQFCEHFLAPLALMHYTRKPLQQLFLSYPDGFPLTVVSSMLPWKTKFNLNLYLHIHLQSSIEQKKNRSVKKELAFSKAKLQNILRSLKELINGLRLDQPTGVWSNYYDEASERENYLENKKEIITNWLSKLTFKKAIDLGANEGEFSELLWQRNVYTISADFDHYSINRLYKKIGKENRTNAQPLILDLSQPTPSFGVNNTERPSFISRSQCDLVMALALIHHLAIGKNIPFDSIAKLFKSFGRILIVEFVPKSDEKVQVMLQNRQDIFDNYTEQDFLDSFCTYYKVLDQKSIANSGRTLFLMQLHEA